MAENKEEQLNSLGNTGRKRSEIQAGKTELKRTKTVSYLTGTLMDKEQRLAERAQKGLQEQERGYRGTGF